MFSEDGKLLREFYEQLPMGVTIEDYSGVKRGIDKLINEGVGDLGQYLIENPDVFLGLVKSIKIIDANNRMLKLFNINSLQEYKDYHIGFVKDDEWIEFYIQEILSLINNGKHSGEYLDLIADGYSINFRCNTWIPAGHEADWSLVITTHEDMAEKTQAEKMLRERDVHIEQALSLANMGAYVWDNINLGYEYVSPEFASLFGYSVDEILWKSKQAGDYLLGIHPDDVDYLTQMMDDSSKQHERAQVTYRIIRKDGSVRTVRDIAQHFYDTNGVCLKSIGCTQDISDITETQNLLSETQANYRWASEIGKLGHYVWDEVKNQCDYCSPELAHMYDMTPEAFIEISLQHDQNLELVHPDDKAMYAAASKVLDQDIDVVFRTIRCDGNVAYFHESGRRIWDEKGKAVKTHGIIQDITDQKNTENALQIALKDAEQANQAKSEFLATMSHEFRTPLNAILGFSEMMRAQYFGPMGSNNYNTYANDIHHSGEHLLALVNDVLDIAAIEAGKRPMVKEAIALDDLLKDCMKSVAKVAEDGGVELSIEAADNLPSLYADKRSITQIFLNIFSNATKFTNPGGTVSVHAKATQDEIVVSVTDTGIGIPPSKISVITEPFIQADSNPHKAQEGSGLGLSIVKSLVESHGGSLKIESTVDVGTTVSVDFPVQKII
ncbi:MAG: PAS domain-containing sensor histidine kinase [Rhodospirillales bacterium]|nr:PAS domain-containing sensor histidine kinase [Rhodospirillales bacterium]